MLKRTLILVLACTAIMDICLTHNIRLTAALVLVYWIGRWLKTGEVL